MDYQAKSIDPDQNRFRFYSMQIEKNLFNEYILTCSFGRIGKPGGTKVFFGNKKSCQKRFEQIKRKREKRGYIEDKGENH